MYYSIPQPIYFLFLSHVVAMLAQEPPVNMANSNPNVTFSFLALSDWTPLFGTLDAEAESFDAVIDILLFNSYPELIWWSNVL